MSLGILDFEVLELLRAVDPGAALREFEQFELLAPLGHGEGHPVEQQRRGGQERHDHLAGQLAPGDVLDDVLHGQRQHVALVAAHAGGQLHGLHADDRPMADAHEVAIGRVVVRQQREDIHVDDPGADDHRTARVVIQRVEPLLEPLRRLELQRGRRTLHLRLEVAAHGTQIALQHRLDHRDELPVRFLVLQPRTGPPAVAEVVLQAHAVAPLRDPFGCEVEPAGAQRHHLADEIEHAALHGHRAVGTVVARPVAHELPRRLHARKVFAPHDDPRIGLVVLEQDVIARLQGLDERVLQQQGIGFAPHDDVADLDDLLDEHAHFGRVIAVLGEIGGDALAQALRLSDIDDRAVAVYELVDARRQRQQRDLLLDTLLLRFGHNEYKDNEYSVTRHKPGSGRSESHPERHPQRNACTLLCSRPGDSVVFRD